MFDENSFIAKLKLLQEEYSGQVGDARPSQVVLGIGDDAAVHQTRAKYQISCSDQLLEGRHYLADTAAPRLGAKLLKRNLSDMAAMGGKPRYCLVNCAIRKDMSEECLLDFYRGLLATAQQYGVELIGGDLAASFHDNVFSLTLLGESEDFQRRHGAREGDVLCAVGEFGYSFESEHHLDFEPCLEEGAYLLKQGFLSSMMDLTDGILADLPRMLDSNLAAIIEPESLSPRLFQGKEASIKRRLCDGEDYGLIFTLPASDVEGLKATWPFESKLNFFGRLVERKTAPILSADGEDLLAQYGKAFDHFKED